MMGVRRVCSLTARFSALRLFLIILAIDAASSRLAIAQIETVMRDIRARYEFLHPQQTLPPWPVCQAGGAQNDQNLWLPVGYYDCDAINGIVSPQAEAAIEGLYAICGDFVREEFGNPEGRDGSEQPQHYNFLDFSFPYPVTPSNYSEVVNKLQSAVEKLRYVGRPLGFATFDSNELLSGKMSAGGYVETGTAGPPGSDDGTCAIAFDEAVLDGQAAWQQNGWTNPQTCGAGGECPTIQEQLTAGRIYCCLVQNQAQPDVVRVRTVGHGQAIEW